MVCKAVLGDRAWADVHCWVGNGGPDLPNLAALAKLDANFGFARSVGVVLDIEEDLAEAMKLAARTLLALGSTVAPVHGVFSTEKTPTGVFLAPHGTTTGGIEGLCRPAVSDGKLASCVDALLSCAGSPHGNKARTDKGWLQAYLSMQKKPRRFHEIFTSPSVVDAGHSSFAALRSFLAKL